jgi:hypothetical protein
MLNLAKRGTSQADLDLEWWTRFWNGDQRMTGEQDLECPRFGCTFVLVVAGVVNDVFAGVVSSFRRGRRLRLLSSVC